MVKRFSLIIQLYDAFVLEREWPKGSMTLKKAILVVEDEAEISTLLQNALNNEGFETNVICNGENAVTAAISTNTCLILLDMGLPGINGLDVCKRLKQRVETQSIPVIFLTGKNDEADIVLGLEMGADDYITKPFHMRELVARVRTVLRRFAAAEAASDSRVLKCGPLCLDLLKFEATVNGDSRTFTLTEFKLLRALMESPGRVFTRDQLLDKISDGQAATLDRNIDVHIASIRKKLKNEATQIISVRGIGYKLRENA